MSLSKPLRKPRFRDWLIYILDNNLCSEDAKWKDRSRRTAVIRWPHKSRGTWSLEKDAKLFKMWAITSGKYRANMDTPNPKSWKCNFRMNLNICKNIIELKQERIPKGPNACRVFKFLDRRTTLQHCSFPGYEEFGRNRCIPPQLRHNYATEGYVPAIMQDTTWFQNGTAQPALQNINPTLAGVTNTAKYMYPADMEEIPPQVMDDICSLQTLSSEPSMTGFEPVQQDHPLDFQSSSTSTEPNVTGFEPAEEDPLKNQIDNFQATELNKMADSFAEQPNFCETHM